MLGRLCLVSSQGWVVASMGGGRFPGRESQQSSLQDRKSMDFGSVDSRWKSCLADGRTGSQGEAVRDSEKGPADSKLCLLQKNLGVGGRWVWACQW